MTNTLTPIWDVQYRDEMTAKALANVIYAASVLAEHSNSPDIADALLLLHHKAILRYQAVQATAAA